jgi:rsbT co-antagonist protein RsbR
MSSKQFTENLAAIIEKSRAVLDEEWTALVMDTWGHKYPGILSRDELHNHANMYITELSAYFGSCEDPMTVVMPDNRLIKIVTELSAEHGTRGIKPLDTALYVVAIKKVINKQLSRELASTPTQLVGCMDVLSNVLDHLTLLTFEAYTNAREKIIAQQSQSLLELSTPVILLWNNVLLLPLVGVIDTIRARQFTERMLEAITRHEGIVTIIDVTGVPVFDSGVARHIMKAVEAAQLLGSKIVMTGISPEGAQTLTKLGISFANVISRVSLRAGVAEALKIVGRRIESYNGTVS